MESKHFHEKAHQHENKLVHANIHCVTAAFSKRFPLLISRLLIDYNINSWCVFNNSNGLYADALSKVERRG